MDVSLVPQKRKQQINEIIENPVETGIGVVITNIVATFNIGTPVDLQKIALKSRNAEYNPQRFAAVVMRISEPRATGLIFRSGKLTVNGVKSEQDAKLAAKKYRFFLSFSF